MDRSIVSSRVDGRPAGVLVVGVNGTGKTTTVGKLARVLVAEDKDVLLGAADTFRAAAADQLQTWGERVGVPTIRSDRDGADPAAVAFDAVKAAAELEADVVHDRHRRPPAEQGRPDGRARQGQAGHREAGPIDEVLLVLDATTGQNGMSQAEVFSEVVKITGIVLTKLDGTAKGGIVVAVSVSSASRSSWSGWARVPTTWPRSTPRPSSTPSSTDLRYTGFSRRHSWRRSSRGWRGSVNAHRTAFTASEPAGSVTARSVTGSAGSRSISLAHNGSSATAPAARHAYPGRSTQLSGGCSRRNRAASWAAVDPASSGR